MSEFIDFSVHDSVATILVNRPQMANAFNPEMMKRFGSCLDEAVEDSSVRIVKIKAAGKNFCAGADLKWLQSVNEYSYEENVQDALELSSLMEKIFKLRKPTIGRVQGAAYGGGAGLIAALDIVICTKESHFAFSEARLGMAPSVIAPYLMYRIGPQNCRRLFLTGEKISADFARQIGLVDEVVDESKLDEKIDEVIKDMLFGSAEALQRCKEIAQTIPFLQVEELREYTTKCIAQLRMSKEAKKRMSHFLQKMDKKKRS